MSYAYMDHADWVHRNTKQEMSPLGKTVANIIGYVGGGIYNCPVNINKTDWTDDRYIKVIWRAYMSNWDFSELSKLWILCHRKMIRVTISPCNQRYLKLEFWQRKTRTGSMSKRLPDCEEMIQLVDAEFHDGYDHL